MDKKEFRYQKNDLLETEITDLGNDGEGIGRADGYTLFVKDAVIGDHLQVRLTKVKKNYAYARVEKILQPSPDRVTPVCQIARPCGGCQIQAMRYEAQLRFKEQKVRNNLIRLGGFGAAEIDAVMEPIRGMEEVADDFGAGDVADSGASGVGVGCFHYRNKAQFPIGTGKDGQPVAGFYAGRTHDIMPVPAEGCAIGVTENQQVLDILIAHMKKHRIPAYDEQTGRGLVRHVLIRKGFVSGQLMVCVVINPARRGAGTQDPEWIPGQKQLVEALKSLPGMTSISVSINREKTNVILGTEIHTLWGSETIEDTLCGLTFRISPLSFYQVNPVQAQRLYEQAISYAGLTGTETVWDLYCGIGTITLAMSRKAGRVYGVEIIPEAIRDARENAQVNGIENASFYVGKAEEVLPHLYETEGIHADVIVVDPPRKGCDEACLSTMLEMKPERIVYVSCDSATLARDLRILTEGGYRLSAVRAFDMFPQSVHVETVCLLSKLHEAKHPVSVKLDMDEMDLTSVESKSTYEEIKKYVAEHNEGMKVSSLNIAQVKRDRGLVLGENYNLAKSEDYRQPLCPKKKEEAIVDALKAFQMI